MPVTRIVVGRGKSVPSNPKDPASEWTKSYFEVEATLDPKDNPDTVKDSLDYMVSMWLGEVSPAEIEKIPEIDIEALPWARKDRSKAGPGEWGWIFGPNSNKGAPEGSEPLIRLLDEHNGKVELPPYEVTYSKDKTFINRSAVKETSK